MKLWFGRVVYSGEGIEMERQFETEAEARAYAAGFDDAKEVATNGDEDALEDYFSCVSDEPSVDE